MHSADHPTHILHPTPGIAYALFHQEGHLSASSAITNCSFVPDPAILFLPFSFPLLSLTFKQTSNCPGMSVLGCQASACHHHTYLHNCIYLGSHNNKMGYLCTIWMTRCWYHLPFYHNSLFVMWLNRVPTTPKLLSSSEDDSNIIEFTIVSSSEDDSNATEFTLVLDHVPHGWLDWGVTFLVGFLVKLYVVWYQGLDQMACSSPVTYEGQITVIS